MNLKDLENFYKISRYKSFTLASKMLDVSQPTLSESIKRLEKTVKTKLFYRSKSGIKLTPSGEQILIEVGTMLSVKHKIESMTNNPLNIQHQFKIGCHDIVAGYFLNNFFNKIYSKYSKLIINLEHNHSRNIQQQIQDGKVDIGIVVNPIKNPDLIIKPICHDKICIWSSSLKKYKCRTDQFIADMNMYQVSSILRSWKEPPTHHISTTNFHLIGQLSEQGIGYGILPKRFVDQKNLKLKQVFPHLKYLDQFSLVYRPEFGKIEIEKFVIDSIIHSF